MKWTFLLALTALLTAGSAHAGDCGGSHGDVVQHIFEEADGNDDGELDAVEYAAAGLERFGVTFEETDLDADGVTTFDEYLELYELHHTPGGRAEA